MAIAGKVAITPKGNWSASTAYQKLDLVYYNNGSYVSIQPSTGVTPTNTAYWMLVLQSAGEADLEGIIDGTTQVGNALTLDGHGAEYFAKGTDLANYLPLTGGTLTAQHYLPLGLKNANGNNSYIQFEGNDGVLGYLGFESTNVLRLLSVVGGYLGDILHTGNKPTGTYTGNGSAATRTINIGGIGDLLYITGGYNTWALVGYQGAVVKNGTTLVSLDIAEAYFDTGVLYLATTNSVLNGASATNYWRLL